VSTQTLIIGEIMDIEMELAALRKMTAKELQQKHVELFQEPSRSCNRQWLFRRVAWRMQALAEGDITERAKERARQLVREADLRIRPPKEHKMPEATGIRGCPSKFKAVRDERLPMPGGFIKGKYKGQLYHVDVLNNGFKFDGELYRSLSEIAHKITGCHWNGYHFFGLNNKRAQ